MNTKKTLEEIGFLEVRYYILMKEIHEGNYTRELGNELSNIGKTKYELLEQVVESMGDLNPTEKPIPQQNLELPDRGEIAQLIEEFAYQYHNNFKTPLPSEVKDILKRLL